MSYPDPALTAQLRALLRREHNLLRELLDLMSSERAALLASEELRDILEQKSSLLKQVEAATTERLHWMRQQGIAVDETDQRDSIFRLTGSADLVRQYDEFIASAQACRQANQGLGQINRRRGQFIHRTAAGLGLAAQPQDRNYSPRGRSGGATAESRLLGSA